MKSPFLVFFSHSSAFSVTVISVVSDGLWKSMMWTSNTSTADPGILDPKRNFNIFFNSTITTQIAEKEQVTHLYPPLHKPDAEVWWWCVSPPHRLQLDPGPCRRSRSRGPHRCHTYDYESSCRTENVKNFLSKFSERCIKPHSHWHIITNSSWKKNKHIASFLAYRIFCCCCLMWPCEEKQRLHWGTIVCVKSQHEMISLVFFSDEMVLYKENRKLF